MSTVSTTDGIPLPSSTGTCERTFVRSIMVAIDRATREWSIAQRHRQSDAAKAAYANLYV